MFEVNLSQQFQEELMEPYRPLNASIKIEKLTDINMQYTIFTWLRCSPTVSSSDHIVSNDKMINKLERKQSWHLPGETEENHRKTSVKTAGLQAKI
jgi:hypothetical protein